MIMPFKRDLRLHGKSPHVVATMRSYPILVRDGILDRIKLMPFFATFKFGSNTAIQIQAPSLPFCGVYLLQEQMSPDGDPNVGEVRFRTVARIGIGVIIQNNDTVAAEYQLDAASQALMTGLFADPTLYNNDVFKIQSFSAGTRQHNFGSIGKDNETPIAELRLEISYDLGTITYPPYVPDDLEIIHVETAFPLKGDTSRVQQVKTQYDLEQNNE
jgi:hypothetical protein